MNNKGFAITGVMYSILVLFIVLSALIIFNLQNKKVLLDKLKDDTINNIENNLINYDDVNTKYGPTFVSPKIGETHKGIVYLDPTNLNKYCDEANSVSTTETKTGCMKWYIFDDSGDNYKMILDHNTTARIKWNDSNSNVAYESSNLKPVVDDLVNTSGWKVTPRLITAQEVNTIVGGVSTWDVNDYNTWFFFEGTGTNKQTHPTYNESNRSKYDWLYNNLNKCKSYSTDHGCTIEDNNTYIGYGTAGDGNTWAYWVSTPVGTAGSGSRVWQVDWNGGFTNYHANTPNYGIRPVITIPKNTVINEVCPYQSGQEFTFDYTGDVQTFKTPCSGNYKLEVWGAQGGSYDSNILGGNGGYSSGTIQSTLYSNLYVTVGGKGILCTSGQCAGGYNGGGAGITGNQSGSSGGGATSIASSNGTLYQIGVNNKKDTVFIIAGGGGGSGMWAATGVFPSSRNGYGGVGGGESGTNGTTNEPAYSNNFGGTGGTQSTGGTRDSSSVCGASTLNYQGTYGQGGGSADSTCGGNGGGGGYYGGGGSLRGHNGAGGGSGYIGGVSNGQTIAGNATMPTHDGKSTMTGNIGNGYAKITYLGE